MELVVWETLVGQIIQPGKIQTFTYGLSSGEPETFGPSLVSLVRRALGEFIALSLHCFTDGAQGLERVLQERVVSCL